VDGPLQTSRPADENPCVDPLPVEQDEVFPEHFLASLYGTLALALAATVWSAMAAVFGPWSLPAAPGVGWLIGWACRHGGRRMDPVIRAVSWLLALAGALLALFAFSVFSATQTSPDSGLQLRLVGAEYLRLFAEPPWFGSAAVLIVLSGTWYSLRGPVRRRTAVRLTGESLRDLGEASPRAERRPPDERDSRAA